MSRLIYRQSLNTSGSNHIRPEIQLHLRLSHQICWSRQSPLSRSMAMKKLSLMRMSRFSLPVSSRLHMLPIMCSYPWSQECRNLLYKTSRIKDAIDNWPKNSDLDWSTAIFSARDWEALDTTLSSKSQMYEQWLTWQCSGFCGTQLWLYVETHWATGNV